MGARFKCPHRDPPIASRTVKPLGLLGIRFIQLEVVISENAGSLCLTGREGALMFILLVHQGIAPAG